MTCDEGAAKELNLDEGVEDHMRTQLDDFLALPARRLGFTVKVS